MSRYSESYIFKETRSSVLHSHKVYQYFYKSNIYKLKLHSQRLCSSIYFREIYNPKKTFLIMYPSNNTQYESTENITVSTEATTITISPLPFVSKPFLDTTTRSKNKMNDLTRILTNKLKNWLISNQRHSTPPLRGYGCAKIRN